MRIRTLLVAGVAAAAVYFAVFGGEYNIFELRRLEKRAAIEQARIDSLRVQVDSMRARADSLRDDSAAIERLARERYGMIRDGERLYRFAEPESARDSVSGGPDAVAAEPAAGAAN